MVTKRRLFPIAVALLAVLLSAACSNERPGPTGRMGPTFSVDVDLNVEGTPLRLTDVERCPEYLRAPGFIGMNVGNPYYVAEYGGFTVTQGRWRMLVGAPYMCRYPSECRAINSAECRNPSPQHLLRDHLPLIGVLPVDEDGPLRLYLSREAMNHPGEPVRLEGIDAVVPARPGAVSNVAPLPLRPMLHAEIPGRCYRAWVLSPADPAKWEKNPASAAFAAAAGRHPVAVPGLVALTMEEVFDRRVEAYLVHGAHTVATAWSKIEDGLIFRTMIDFAEDPMIWLSSPDDLTGTMLGLGTHGRLPVNHPGHPIPDDYRPPATGIERLTFLRRSDGIFRPAAERVPIGEYWPEDGECATPAPLQSRNQGRGQGDVYPEGGVSLVEPREGILVDLDGTRLSLRFRDIIYWPSRHTYYRVIASTIRLPIPEGN